MAHDQPPIGRETLDSLSKVSLSKTSTVAPFPREFEVGRAYLKGAARARASSHGEMKRIFVQEHQIGRSLGARLAAFESGYLKPFDVVILEGDAAEQIGTFETFYIGEEAADDATQEDEVGDELEGGAAAAELDVAGPPARTGGGH